MLSPINSFAALSIISGVAHFSFGRIILQYGEDIKTDNGYFEDQRVILRYTAIF